MEAYIIDGYRSAVTKAKRGGFRNFRSDDLSVLVIKHLLNKFPGIELGRINDVIVGCANPEGEQGLQIGRLISARALGTGVPGMTINRYCASGLEAISLAVSKIKAGFGDIYVAGGAESMSMIPMTGYKLAPSYQANLENINYHVSMGATAEAVADKYKITREQSDIFSYESHMKAAKAIDEGFFKEKILPIDVETKYVENDIKVKKNMIVEVDDGVRRDTSIEALKKLRAAFKKDGVVTAGNSSQTSDGVAFTLVVSEKIVKELNLKPMAKLLSVSVGGVDPIYMGVGPCIAIPKALKKANLNLNDIDQIELNEAFAAQSLAVIKSSELNPKIVNPNGGAIALGHPLGCTGAKLTIQLINDLKRNNKKYGIVTACVGGGQGIAGVFENLM